MKKEFGWWSNNFFEGTIKEGIRIYLGKHAMNSGVQFIRQS
jgi:hypothetical protein